MRTNTCILRNYFDRDLAAIKILSHIRGCSRMLNGMCRRKITIKIAVKVNDSIGIYIAIATS